MLSVLRQHADEAVRRFDLGWRERKALRDLVRCRTAALGGHLEVCPGCDYRRPSYNSCRNRHCPGCQEGRRRQWVELREKRVLPVPHFQVVFTLPAELRAIAKAAPRVVLDLLFDAASDVLQQLARQRMDARLAMTMVLHTWTREMNWHPHVHVVVSGGGLSLDGARWVASRPRYLFPERVMGAMFRGRMLATLEEARKQGRLGPISLTRRTLRAKDWVVHVTPPDDRPVEHVVRYLARYVYGVAIHDARLLDVGAQSVTFRTRGAQTRTVSGPEFVRLFAQHILPSRFRKVRHYGLLAPGLAAALEVARTLVAGPAAPQQSEPPDANEDHEAEELGAVVLPLCPSCHAHRLEPRPLPVVAASARGPPWW